MKPTRLSLFFLIAVLASCEAPTQPFDERTDVLAFRSNARAGQAAACRARGLTSVVEGSLDIGDCSVEGDGELRRQDLYRVNQALLGNRDRSGSTMITVEVRADFDAAFGLGPFDGSVVPTPAYAEALVLAGEPDQPTFGDKFSVVGERNLYALRVAGEAADQLGDYTLTATLEPTSNACANSGHVYLQGDVRFSGVISDPPGTCRGGSRTFSGGDPANYQLWRVKLLPGESVSVTLTGVTDPSVMLAAGVWLGDPNIVTDDGGGIGDSDRSVTLTNTFSVERFFLIEVSADVGASSPFTLEVDGP